MMINEMCCPSCLEDKQLDKFEEKVVDLISFDNKLIQSLIDKETTNKLIEFRRRHIFVPKSQNSQYKYCPGFLLEVINPD